jgi:hypothetical protein
MQVKCVTATPTCSVSYVLVIPKLNDFSVTGHNFPLVTDEQRGRFVYPVRRAFSLLERAPCVSLFDTPPSFICHFSELNECVIQSKHQSKIDYISASCCTVFNTSICSIYSHIYSHINKEETQRPEGRTHYHTTHTHNSSATKRRFPIWEDSLYGIVFKKSTTGYSPKIK